MAFCSITKEQYDNLTQWVYKVIKEGDYVGIKELMQDIYKAVYDISKNDVQALTYAGLTPGAVLLVIATDVPSSKIIRNIPDDLNKLYDLRDTLADDLPAVKRFITDTPISIYTKEQAEAAMKALEDTQDYEEFRDLARVPETVQYLAEPGNEELAQRYYDKFNELHDKFTADLIKKRAEALAKIEADKKEIKEEEEKKASDLLPDIYSEEGFTIEQENVTAEPLNMLAYVTPLKSVNKELIHEDLDPDAEMTITPNEYDHFMSEFYNNNPLVNGKFSLFLQQDNPSLIARRMLDEGDRLKAMENIGQVIVIKNEHGDEVTFGSAGVITDVNHPLYNAPVVTSFNVKAFDLYREYRVDILSRKLGLPAAEIEKFYDKQYARGALARSYISQGKTEGYPIKAIHQSRGVIERTEEGKVKTRFRKKDGSSALVAVTVVKTDRVIHGTPFVAGQIVATVKRNNVMQAFAVSASEFRKLEGEHGTMVKNAVNFNLYRDYDTKEEARAMIKNFLSKVIYTKANHIRLRVTFDSAKKKYRIVFDKKNAKNMFEPVTQAMLALQRINIVEAIITSGSLEVPTMGGVVILNSTQYDDMMRDNVSTDRRALIDTKDNFHLKELNAYFSFTVPENLQPDAKLLRKVGVDYEVNGEMRHFVVTMYEKADGGFTNYIFENDKLITGVEQLSMFHRKNIVGKINEDLAAGKFDVKPEETAEEKPAEETPSENIVVEEVKPEEEERPPGPPISNQQEAISTGYVSNLTKATDSIATFKLPGGRMAMIDINKADPFHKDIIKGKALTKEQIQMIVNKLKDGSYPQKIALLISGDHFIIGMKGYNFYQVFDQNLNVVPPSSIPASEIDKYNEQNPCK